jgi:hypothetical protein
MDVSPALLVDRVLQTRNSQTTQDVQINELKKAMDMQESASAALLNAVAGICRWEAVDRWGRRSIRSRDARVLTDGCYATCACNRTPRAFATLSTVARLGLPFSLNAL